MMQAAEKGPAGEKEDMDQDGTLRTLRGAVLTLIACLSISCSAHAAGPQTDTASGRVATLLAREGFVGEVLVADRERLRVASVAGGTQPGGRWRWASVSKQVAAALAMRQVQAGRMGLDDPVARHLPAAAGHPAVTVRQLLMHTSGLPNPEVATLPADPLPACLAAAIEPPGQRFEYRNCDTIVLARLLEHVSGRPYAELLRDELTAELGSQGIALDSAPPEIATYGAAGAMSGTAMELLAFDRALLAQRWLSPENTRTMWAGEPRLGYVALGAWAFEASIKGCSAPVPLVERRGAVSGVQVRNLIAPTLGVVVIAFTPSESFEFGEVWQGRGFTHDLLATALCD
jgi:CubicO group peptidase (beta-lactamase class C family)